MEGAEALSTPASMSAELDSMFSESATPSTEPVQETQQTAPELTQADVTPPAEETAQPVAEETAPESPFEDDEIGEPRITDNGKGQKEYHYPEKKAQMMLANHKFAKELREAIPGLTIQDATTHYQAFANMAKLNHALASGDVRSFLAQWNESAPGSVPQIAISAAQALYDVEPEVFEREIATPVIANALQSMEREAFEELRSAQASGDPEAVKIANQRVFAAQYASWKATGRYTMLDKGNAPVQDPFAAQREAFEREKQTFHQQRQQEAQQRYQGIQRDFDTRLNTRFDSMIERTMEKVKDHFAANPNFKNVTSKYLAQEVKDRIGENTAWSAVYNTEKEKALRSGDAKALGDVEKKYLSRAESLLVAELKKVVPSATKATVDASKQRHEALAASQRKEVGNGKPAPQSIVSNPAKAGSYKSWEKELDALIQT